MNVDLSIQLPSPQELRRAVELYLDHAYREAPAAMRNLLAGDDLDVARWLMGSGAERDPASAPLEQVRSFSIRLGNETYPHMKLRLSRPPSSTQFIFSVDSHDAFLRAQPGSADYEPLEALKRHNNAVAEAIMVAWEAQGIPTERGYMRQKLQQAREQRAGQ